MSFSKEEAQFILTAVDTHLRQTGIAAAKMALLVVSKLQQGLQMDADLQALKESGDKKEEAP